MKLSALLIYLIPFLGCASPQIPELLIYKNDTIPIYNLIIEDYLELNNTNILGENQGNLFGLNFRGGSFNCWRGYQGIYKIENDSLFIVNMIPVGEILMIKESLDVEIQTNRKSLFYEIFKDRIIDNKVFVNWYSGNLGIGKGPLLRWDGVFKHVSEKETLITLKKGKVKNVREIQNYVDLPQGISRRYQEKMSDYIFRLLAEINWKNDLGYDCSEEYEFRIGKNGTIKNVRINQYKTKEEITPFWDKKAYHYCLKTIKNKIKKIQFDLVKNEGNNIEELIVLEIWQNEDGTIENWTR